MNNKILCTVAILTRNSAQTLGRALESVREFDDLIICDGGSTDGTLDIARAYGARVVLQSRDFLDDEGRINNYAGVRNQTLAAAKHDWYFFLDSDEYLSPALVEEIRATAAGNSAAYWVPRKYVWRDSIIDCAVTYPTQQMRFFNRRSAQTFIKEVHERIELLAGVTPRRLRAPMLVPVPETVDAMKRKWLYYLKLESARRTPKVPRLRPALREAAIGCLYLLRLVRIRLFCRGTKLPLAYEWARVWYQWRLVVSLFT